jgi:hypothetical protein
LGINPSAGIKLGPSWKIVTEGMEVRAELLVLSAASQLDAVVNQR